METIAVILALLCIATGFVAQHFKANIPALLMVMLGTFLLTALLLCERPHTPKAIDVYRGRTTLKITCIDGVPVDSIVVFKSKE